MGGRQNFWRSVIQALPKDTLQQATKKVSIPETKNPAATMTGPVVEGIFAINKPGAISSAQVIRDAQARFNPSKLFAPWLQKEEDRLERESQNQMKKRGRSKRQRGRVKMGHGGTLDPLATGVLILGVGSGTKALSQFLECTKSYETVLLFGKATDTYDTEGKVVASKEFNHLTREKVEEALKKYQGKIMQRPPIFSALKVQGKKLYEYAREGKEVPIEIVERPVEVKHIELVEWIEGGTHQWHWPEEEADKEVTNLADKVLHLGGEAKPDSAGVKRKRGEDKTVDGTAESDAPSSRPKRSKEGNESPASGALPADAGVGGATLETTDREPCPAPACRIRMTVTSGFYVRSLCQDLGAAVGSLGCMASLVRTRQGDFEISKNVLEYEDLAKGEEVWAPQVQKMLEDWQIENGHLPAVSDQAQPGAGGSRVKAEQADEYPRDRRRNTSSPEA